MCQQQPEILGMVCVFLRSYAFFFSLFRRVRKIAKKRLIASSCLLCPSVRFEQLGSHWKNFHEILSFDYLSKICRENSIFSKIFQEWRVLFVKTYVHLWHCTAEFFVEWEMFQTKVVEEMKHVLCSINLQQNSAFYEIIWKNTVEPTV